MGRLKTPFSSLLPPLSSEEKAALAASIKAEGVRDPVHVTEDGEVLDGHNRLEICPTSPRYVVPNSGQWPADERMAYAIRVNLGRRHLSPGQRNEFDRLQMIPLARSLRWGSGWKKAMKDPGAKGVRSEAEVGKMLGRARETVRNWTATTPGQEAKCSKPVQVTEKIPAAAHPAILAALESGQSQAQVAADYKVSQQLISRIASRAARKAARELARPDPSALPHGLVHGDFREVAKSIPDASVDLIFTDPPYDTGSVPMYGDLALLADRVLIDGGSLLCYCGHRLIPKILDEFAKSKMRFYWVCACIHTGQSARMPRTGQVVKWKPILWFIKGSERYDTAVMVEDAVFSTQEKEHHDWQQGIQEASYYIDKLSPAAGVVFDPFGGGGTTAVAAGKAGRKWITCDQDLDAVATIARRLADAGLGT